MIQIPQLPASFYEEHPSLQLIRDIAWSSSTNPAPADAVLGVLLARVAAMIPIETQLPSNGSVNYLVAVIGPSGTGKSTAQRVAVEMIPDIGTDLDSRGIGSGEGMIEAYLGRQKVDDGWEKCQKHTSSYFYVDEAQTFLNANTRIGSTTLGTLRSMWSGTDVGVINATVDTSRHLKHGTYRFSAALGFQPAYATQLLHDDAGGTPQRFLFVSAMDRNIPDVATMPNRRLAAPTPLHGPITVDQEIKRIMRDRCVRVSRGEIELDPLDTHRDLLQLKTAYLLSVLCGCTAGVDLTWWNLAGQVMNTSCAIRNALFDEGKRRDHDTRVRKVENDIATSDMKREKDVARLSASLGRGAIILGPSPIEKLVRRLRGTERNNYDIDHALKHGLLIQVDKRNLYRAGPNAIE